MNTIAVARLENQSSRLVHAVRPAMDGTYCQMPKAFVVMGFQSPEAISCRICLSALRKAMSVCADCGCVGQGSLCGACRIFQKRSPGQRRGRARKPAYCEFGAERLAELYRRYQQDESMMTLAAEAGVSLPTLKTRFREAGYTIRGRYEAAQARKRADQAVVAIEFPIHEQATWQRHYVSEREDRVLRCIYRATVAGRRITRREMAAAAGYQVGSLTKTIGNLKRRRLLRANGRQLEVTQLGRRREVRETPHERMAAVYISGMNCGDLARSAGVSTNAALKFIKRQLKQ